MRFSFSNDMALAHMTKSKLSPNYQTPVTGVAEELLIKIIRLAQRVMMKNSMQYSLNSF